MSAIRWMSVDLGMTRQHEHIAVTGIQKHPNYVHVYTVYTQAVRLALTQSTAYRTHKRMMEGYLYITCAFFRIVHTPKMWKIEKEKQRIQQS